MDWPPRIAWALAVGSLLGACGQLSGLGRYSEKDHAAAVHEAEGGVKGTVDASGDGAEAGCDGGFIACSGECVDPSSPLNCGTCGNACATTLANAEPACHGVCTFTCRSGFGFCRAACIPLTAATDCGLCGNVCGGPTPVCAPAGPSYACAAGCPPTASMLCSGTCADLQSDVSNCGGCGSACPKGQTCATGHCVGCGASCPTSTVSAYACARGGCNGAGGTCSAAGPCYCTDDAQCGSGKCLKVSGQNDVSCGAHCTGAGAADGFDCTLAAPGIPAACTASFGYTPSNFAPGSYAPPAASTTINCNPTYNSSTHAFTGWCAGQTAPTIYSSIAQTGGGPNVDILAFRSLTLAAGSTLTLTSSGGGNGVVLAVYGDASILGTILANGAAGAPNTTGAGASGPGGSYSCAASAGGNGSDANPNPPHSRNTGGAGGGASGGGGAGGDDNAGMTGGLPAGGGAAGAARSDPSIVPLYGGCPGGNSGSCGQTQSGGGGGGAVQISAAGSLQVAAGALISAAGGGGGSAPSAESCNGGAYVGGAGGGSGGAILLESSNTSVLGTTNVNGGAGGASQGTNGGAGGSSAAPTGGNGATASSSGSGGGGGYGYRKTSSGAAAVYACSTSLSPTPACSSTHAGCLCVADGDCPSGQCADASGQCTGTCSGATAAGSYDSANCALPTSAPSAWACAAGNCETVPSPGGTCSAAGAACWCTGDAQCEGGLCAAWAGCPSGACTGAGTPDGLHCVP